MSFYIAEFQIGKVYSFNTRSPVFLGAVQQRVKLKSIVDADMARRYEPIDQLHAEIYPTLPPGTPNDPNALTYYIFEGLNKKLIILADSWIDVSSVEVIEYVTISVNIPRASLSDVEKVRMALSAANIEGFVISTS